MTDKLTRRDFLKIGGAGLAGMVVSGAMEHDQSIESGERASLKFPAIVGFVFLDNGKEQNKLEAMYEGPLADIDIELQDMNDNLRAISQTRTNSDGAFFFDNLVPGKYLIMPKGAGGVQDYKRDGIEIDKGSTLCFGGLFAITSEDLKPETKKPQKPPAMPFRDWRTRNG